MRGKDSRQTKTSQAVFYLYQTCDWLCWSTINHGLWAAIVFHSWPGLGWWLYKRTKKDFATVESSENWDWVEALPNIWEGQQISLTSCYCMAWVKDMTLDPSESVNKALSSQAWLELFVLDTTQRGFGLSYWSELEHTHWTDTVLCIEDNMAFILPNLNNLSLDGLL